MPFFNNIVQSNLLLLFTLKILFMNKLFGLKKGIAIFFLLAYSSVFLMSFTVPAKISSLKKKFSGEELFQGIFFARGEVSDKLPEVKKIIGDKMAGLTAEQRRELFNSEDQITAEIKKENPILFEDFKSKIESHNYALVQKGIEEMRNAIIESSYNLNHTSVADKNRFKEAMKSGNANSLLAKNGTGNATCVTVWVSVNIALVFEIAAILMGVLLWNSDPGDGLTQTDLQKDIIVNSIVSNI